MTELQKALVGKLASGDENTVSGAAKAVGMSRQGAAKALAKVHVAKELERLKMRRFDRNVDKAREISLRSVDLVGETLPHLEKSKDMRERLQGAALAITAVAKHTEAYGQEVQVEDEAGAQERARKRIRRALLRGIRLGRSSRDLTELVTLLEARTALSPTSKTSMKAHASAMRYEHSKK